MGLWPGLQVDGIFARPARTVMAMPATMEEHLSNVACCSAQAVASTHACEGAVLKRCMLSCARYHGNACNCEGAFLNAACSSAQAIVAMPATMEAQLWRRNYGHALDAALGLHEAKTPASRRFPLRSWLDRVVQLAGVLQAAPTAGADGPRTQPVFTKDTEAPTCSSFGQHLRIDIWMLQVPMFLSNVVKASDSHLQLSK